MNPRTPARTVFSFSLALILFVGSSLLAQHLTVAQQSQVAKLVHDMIEQNHISQKKIDDEISGKLVDEFIKTLDPQKLYFLHSDIDRFNEFRTSLDDLIKAGNVEFGTIVFDVYLKRLNERIELAHKLIDTKQDFSTKEYLEIDAKEIPWAKSVEDLNERWRKRIKYEYLLMKLETPGEIAAREKKTKKGANEPKLEGDGEGPKVTTDEDARKRLHKRYKAIHDALSKTEPEEVVEMYLTALCETFDPHSGYMSPRAQEDFQIQMRLKLEGIGAALRSEDGYTIVASIVPGGAAAADGRLKVNDKIIAVAGGSAEFVDVVEMKLTKVVELIRGNKGTKVRLKVLTPTSDVKIYELTRQEIQLKEQEVKGDIIDSAGRASGTKGKIGIIHIPSFYRDFEGEEAGDAEFKSTSRDVRKVLHDFQAKGGVDSIILDLRYNGGGALKEAIEVAGLFLGEGAVVQVKDQKGKPKVYRSDEAKPVYSGPLVVLTNRLSASASEIVAGAIKDYNRGLIIGDLTTHGKGTVQNVTPVGQRFLQLLKSPKLGALKLTINQFYRVNGDSTQNTGVLSDIGLPSLLDNMELGEQYLDNALPFDHIDAVPHTRFRFVTTEIASALRENSKKRIAESSDFQKIEKDIDKYLARKQRKTVSLNEDELRKERIEEEQKARDKAESGGDEVPEEQVVFADNSYNNEILRILSDYVSMLQSANVSKK
jgi:carboxyl-terminal processing protease